MSHSNNAGRLRESAQQIEYKKLLRLTKVALLLLWVNK
ncbi:hypothetical protein LDG_6519 [Legionella drancourtii LLAP12]|uniref:Uncharacterized protein n=1 Tax=Legionella drancourtii LLAP12 TaxID=658187 RepID=G9EMP9_9GAMM|nr:hypothetical protein LDG_6519 [Legionella drancourtii LLAP12]